MLVGVMIMLATYGCKDDDAVAGPPKVTKVVVKSVCVIDTPTYECTYIYEVTFEEDLPANSTATFTVVTPTEPNCDSSSVLGAIPILNQLSANVLSSNEVTHTGPPDAEGCVFTVSFVLDRPGESAVRFEDEEMIVE